MSGLGGNKDSKIEQYYSQVEENVIKRGAC